MLRLIPISLDEDALGEAKVNGCSDQAQIVLGTPSFAFLFACYYQAFATGSF